MLSHHLNYFSEAQLVSQDSTVSVKYGAIIVSSGNIIAKGVNKCETARKSLMRRYFSCDHGETIHAEYDCVLRPYNQS
jgi:deoxycytidylate deaminase